MIEYPIARAYVDARVQRIYGGINEIMKEVISRSMWLNKAWPQKRHEPATSDAWNGECGAL